MDSESVFPTIFSSQLKGKRHRDQNVVHSWRDKENLQEILARKGPSEEREWLSKDCVKLRLVSTCIRPTITNVSAHLFRSTLPPGNRKSNRNCHLRDHRRNFRAGAVVCSHTPIHDGEYTHCVTNSGTNQHHNASGSIQRKLVNAMELQGSGCHTTFNFARESSVIRM